MKRIFIIALSAASMAFSAAALDITATPGSLTGERTALQLTRDSKVTVSGSADAADLAVLGYISQYVTSIDLQNLEVISLPARMVMGHKNLTEVTLPQNIAEVGDEAFAGTGLQSVTLPATVSKIGTAAFADCADLKEITFSSATAPALGDNLFKGCTSLTTVKGLTALGKIGNGTFDGCTSLDAAPMSFGNITEIGDYAFRSNALKNINLTGVKKIGKYAFAENNSLSEVELDLKTTLGTGVFFKDENLNTLPEMEDAPALALSYCLGDTLLVVRSRNINEGAYANNKAITHIEMTGDVENVRSHAFRNLTSLKSVDVLELGSGVPETADDAFSGLENEDGNYDIELAVKPGTGSAWESHPLWSRFNINDVSGTTVVDVLKDITAGVSRNGSTVTATANAPIDFMGIYTIDGIVLNESRPGTTEWSVSDIDPNAMVVVKVICGDKAKIVKLK